MHRGRGDHEDPEEPEEQEERHREPVREPGLHRRREEVADHAARVLDGREAVTGGGQVLGDVHERADRDHDEGQADRDARVRLGALGMTHDPDREPHEEDRQGDRGHAEDSCGDRVHRGAERAGDPPPLTGRDDHGERQEEERDAVAPM
ncbi:hypothetical protein D3C74_328160 [compost metagenome]